AHVPRPFLLTARRRTSPRFPYTTLFRSAEREVAQQFEALFIQQVLKQSRQAPMSTLLQSDGTKFVQSLADQQASMELARPGIGLDRKSTRLNSSHVKRSYAVFCLKKKKP